MDLELEFFLVDGNLHLRATGSITDQEVRYQLFATPIMAKVGDSGWRAWDSNGYVFEGLNPYQCYAVRYGIRDAYGEIQWIFEQTRYMNEIEIGDNELIVSMIGLQTQGRSERIGREEQLTEVYLNEDFDRGGAGG
jgi:hypothetical protein